MTIVLGPNQYGKAETRMVWVDRGGSRHHIRDLSVSTALRGDFTAAHVGGDQANVLPTDSQKNTVFAFAREQGVGEIEEFGLALARHFVDDVPAVSAATVEIEEYAWSRIEVDGRPDGHDHAFARRGDGVRTTTVTVEGSGGDQQCSVTSGIDDLVVAKTTGSEFRGFFTDRYTTLAETDDRILATSLVARWRHTSLESPWSESWAGIRRLLLSTFAETHSLALQHSLYAMGEAVLEHHREVSEISFSAPNKHHFLVDLTAFGLDNPGQVFHAADRPYGLIEATVRRDDTGG